MENKTKMDTFEKSEETDCKLIVNITKKSVSLHFRNIMYKK